MTDSRILDIHALQVFLMTAQECNMSGAAQRLGVTQSAVSQAIKSLESYFGTPLINRKRRPLTLTPAGLALRNRGSKLLEDTLNIKGAVLDASQGIKPDLRLGLVDSFAATCGTKLIQNLIDKVGQLSVRTGLSPYNNEGLLRREFDIVISTDPMEDVNGVLRHRLATEQFLVITPIGIQASAKSVKDLLQLAETLPIIRFNPPSHVGAQIERVLRRMNIKLPRRLEVDTADSLTSMVAGGLGWAMTTPLCLLQAKNTAQQVTPLVCEDITASRSLYLIAREGEYSHLIEEIFHIAQSVLVNYAIPELQAIHPLLGTLVKHDQWKKHG